jgi:hypothetical protein
MVRGRYRMIPRPPSSSHGYPFLVFDGRTYLNAILPFFAYLDENAPVADGDRPGPNRKRDKDCYHYARGVYAQQ